MVKEMICKKCKELKIHKANGYCKKCYRPPKKICKKCGELKIITSNGFCSKCYEQPKKICKKCNNLEIMATKKICKKCYKSPKEKCYKCNNIAPVYKRDNIGAICSKCYEQKEKKCCICGNIRRIYKKTENGDICRNCYEKQYERPIGLCKICKKERPIKSTSNGYVCEKCYRVKPKKCIKCGKLSKPYKKYLNGVLCRNCFRAEKYKNDPKYRLKKIIKQRVRENILLYKDRKKVYSSIKYKIDFKSIIEYLLPFPDNITEYHVDHILPLSAFDFNDPDHIKAAFAPENHQWLKADENMKKGAKYDKELFNLYIKKYKNK